MKLTFHGAVRTVTGSQHDNIARNNLLSGNAGLLTVTDQNSITRKHSLQGLSGLLGRTFLNDTDDSIHTASQFQKRTRCQS